MPSQPEPDFFLAGAPKAGTTSLYHYLDQHPQIYMSPLKEPHFFAEELHPKKLGVETRRLISREMQTVRAYLDGPMTAKRFAGPVTEWADYVRLFRGAQGEAAIGEASVCYLWSPSAPRNIARHYPGARIIAVLRNPIERAFAQYLHVMFVRSVPMTFREHVDASLASQSREISPLYPFLELGKYAEQLERYLACFPREHIGIFFYEDYERDPQATLREIFRFLGVDERFTPDMSDRHLPDRIPRFLWATRFLRRTGLWQAVNGITRWAPRSVLRRIAFRNADPGFLKAEDCFRLAEYYRDDVGRLSKLVGRDLGHWLLAGSCQNGGTPTGSNKTKTKAQPSR